MLGGAKCKSPSVRKPSPPSTKLNIINNSAPNHLFTEFSKQKYKSNVKRQQNLIGFNVHQFSNYYNYNHYRLAWSCRGRVRGNVVVSTHTGKGTTIKPISTNANLNLPPPTDPVATITKLRHLHFLHREKKSNQH